MSNESRLSLTIDSCGAKTDAEDLKRALEELEKAGVRVTASTTDAGSAATGAGRSFSQAGREAKSGAGGVNDLNKSLEKTNQDAANATAGLVRMAKQIGLGFAVVKTIDMADEWGQYASRIKQATKSTEEYDYVQRRMVASANDTFRSINETREGFIQLSPILRSVGLSLEQSIDLVDSFSSLLVINAASADKGSNSMNALTKAMQKGKVEGDGWMSIMAAMPNLADKIAAATGKTVEEIRRLGVEGKITADMLSKGLLGSYQENLQQVKDMPTTVRDALRNVQNAFQDYIGWTNEANGVTAGMASGLVLLGNNFGAVAAVIGGVAAGALTLYSSQIALSTYANISNAISLQNKAAKTLSAAQADVSATAAALAHAVAQREAGIVTANVSAATEAHAAATARLTAAQAGYTTVVRGLLGVLGGPVGLALTVGAAAASWLIYSSNSDKANEKIKEMQGSVEILIDRFKKLKEEQRAAMMVEYGNAQQKALSDMESSYKKLEAAVNAAFAKAGMKGAADYRAILLELKNSGANLAPVLEEVAQKTGIPKSKVDEIVGLAGAFRDSEQKATNAKSVLDALKGTQNELASSAGNAATQQGLLNDALVKTDDEGRKYLENLRKQSTLAGKTTELSKLQALAQEGLMILSKEDMALAEQRAKRIDAANRGMKEGNKLENERKAALKSLTKSLTEQVEVLGMTNEQQIIWRFEQQKADKATMDNVRSLLAKDAAHRRAAAASDIETAALIRNRDIQEDLLLFQRKNQLEITGMGQGDAKREQLQKEFDLEQEFANKRSELRRQLVQLDQDQKTKDKVLDEEIYAARRADLERQIEDTRTAEDEKLRILQEYAALKLEAEKSWSDGAMDAWLNYADQAENAYRNAANATSSALNGMQSSLSSGFTSIIMQTETVEDAVRNMAKGMLNSVVSALADMAAQWLVYQAVQLLVGKTTQATEVSTMTFNALAMQQMAALNAFASTAAIPIVGPAMAPAAAITALGLTTPMVTAVTSLSAAGLAGMAHSGIDNIPKEGTWLLDKGERVLNPRQNADFTQFLKKESANDSGRSGNSNGNVIVNLYESRERAGQVEQSAGVDDQRIISVFVENIGSGGKAAQAIERTYGMTRRGR